MFICAEDACVNTAYINRWCTVCPDFYSHCRDVSYSFEAGGVTDHLVQSADDVAEARSNVAVFLPTVQHQLVQGTGAVHGGWQTVVLLDGVNHLGDKRRESQCRHCYT